MTQYPLSEYDSYPFEKLGLDHGSGAQNERHEARQNDQNVHGAAQILGRRVGHGRANVAVASHMLRLRLEIDQQLAVLAAIIEHQLQVEQVTVGLVAGTVRLKVDRFDGEVERRLDQRRPDHRRVVFGE